MAQIDFLSLSPTYGKNVGRKTVRARRSFLLSFLDPQYRLRPKDIPRVLAEAERQGIQGARKVSLQRDARLYANAYRFLTTEDEEDEKERERLRERALRRRSDIEYFGIRCCLEDGIERWKDLPLESLEQPVPLPEVEPPEVRLVATEVLAGINEAAGIVTKVLTRMLEENDQLRGEVVGLREKVDRLQQSIASLKIESLDHLAERYPEIPELFRIAERYRNEQRRAEKETSVWPARSSHFNCAVVFENGFQKDFDALGQSAKQSQVLKALQLLCEQGPSHPSLGTEKLRKSGAPGTPVGASVSRASDKLRFTWQKDPDVLRFYRLLTHKALYHS